MTFAEIAALLSLSLCTATARAQTAFDTLVQNVDAQPQAGSADQALALAQQAIKLDEAEGRRAMHSSDIQTAKDDKDLDNALRVRNTNNFRR